MWLFRWIRIQVYYLACYQSQSGSIQSHNHTSTPCVTKGKDKKLRWWGGEGGGGCPQPDHLLVSMVRINKETRWMELMYILISTFAPCPGFWGWLLQALWTWVAYYAVCLTHWFICRIRQLADMPDGLFPAQSPKPCLDRDEHGFPSPVSWYKHALFQLSSVFCTLKCFDVYKYLYFFSIPCSPSNKCLPPYNKTITSNSFL